MKSLIKLLTKRAINFFVKELINSLYYQKRINPLQFYDFFEAYNAYEEYKSEMRKVPLLPERKTIRQFCVDRILDNFDDEKLNIIEFGVCSGNSLRHFSSIASNSPRSFLLYGFDSWEGLVEDWNGMSRGRLKGSYKCEIPNIPNCKLIKGWVDQTLPKFLSEKTIDVVNLVHLDMDTYTPTKTTLKLLEPYLRDGTIILFDDFYGYAGWSENDNKAFNEFFSNSALEFKYLCFGRYECAIQIIQS